MKFKPIVPIIIFFLVNSASGLIIETTGQVIGGGVMHGFTQCNGFKDYINGSGDQTYTRSLNTDENEKSFTSEYEYKQDPSLAEGVNNTHKASIYDSSSGIEHYVNVFSSGSSKSIAVLTSTETGVETSFVSNSDNGLLEEGIIDSGNIGPAFNCEVDSEKRAPMKIAETHLQGEFTFDSKLKEQKVPVDDVKGMIYKVDSVTLMDAKVLRKGQDTPVILQSYAAPSVPEEQIYYDEARSLFANASKLQSANKTPEANDSANITYKKALDSVSRALEIDPRYYEALIQKGNILMKLGEFSDALSEFDRAIKVDKNSVSLRRKGYALLSLERYTEAFTAFNDALKLNSGDENARAGLTEAFDHVTAYLDKGSNAYYYFNGVNEFYSGNATALDSLQKSIDLGLNASSSTFAKDANEKLNELRSSVKNPSTEGASNDEPSNQQNLTNSIPPT